MGLDAQLKRFFPLILCCAIALAAYFQASGIGRMVVSAVVGGAEPPTPSEGGPMPDAPKPNKSGTPILARNPFDSVTGPLDGSGTPIEGDLPKPEGPTEPVTNEDPACSFGRVVLISAAEDPTYAFAAIEDGQGESRLRRVGEQVGSHTIQAFGWDRVWLAEGAARCQLKLGESAKTAKAPAADGAATPKRKGRQLDPAMASKINKVSDTEYNIERSLVDEILENQAELMRSARIVPEKEGDEVVGIRLFGIRDGTLLNHLGLTNGDRLESINGFAMTDPQKALEAYGRLRTADALKVKINRKGTPMTLEFNIQ